jgi:hypothetical protein
MGNAVYKAHWQSTQGGAVSTCSLIWIELSDLEAASPQGEQIETKQVEKKAITL